MMESVNAPNAGRWAQRFTTHDFTGCPCLFLDRDGVIVEDPGYLHRVEDIRFISGIDEAIIQANHAQVAVVMITNQAGIGRGYYAWEDFFAVQRTVLTHLMEKGAVIDMALACANHVDGEVGYARDDPWRKPGPGMLLEAAREIGVDLARSYIVGDKVSDLNAGQEAGLHGGALLFHGHDDKEQESRSRLLETWAASRQFITCVASTPSEPIQEWLALLPDGSLRYLPTSQSQERVAEPMMQPPC